MIKKGKEIGKEEEKWIFEYSNKLEFDKFFYFEFLMSVCRGLNLRLNNFVIKVQAEVVEGMVCLF